MFLFFIIHSKKQKQKQKTFPPGPNELLLFVNFRGHNPQYLRARHKPSVFEEPAVGLACGNMELLEDGVHMVFRTASGVSQNTEKGKLPAAPAGRKPDHMGTNGP